MAETAGDAQLGETPHSPRRRPRFCANWSRARTRSLHSLSSPPVALALALKHAVESRVGLLQAASACEKQGAPHGSRTLARHRPRPGPCTTVLLRNRHGGGMRLRQGCRRRRLPPPDRRSLPLPRRHSLQHTPPRPFSPGQLPSTLQHSICSWSAWRQPAPTSWQPRASSGAERSTARFWMLATTAPSSQRSSTAGWLRTGEWVAQDANSE